MTKYNNYEYGNINYECGIIMAYKFLGTDFSDFITSSEEVKVSSIQKNIHNVELSTPKGNMYYRTQNLQEDFFIQESTYRMQEDITINGRGDDALLEMQFNLSENGIYYKDNSNKDQFTPARSGNIMFLSAEENQAEILFQKEVQYNTFDIHLPIHSLNHFAGESKLMDSFISQIQKDTSGPLTQKWVSINSYIFNIIQEIKGCLFEGLSRKIYLESKAYELIALLYEGTQKPAQLSELSNVDKERLHEAASIIRDNLETPFSIIELARKVGINQTKLKTGFKSLFGSTVFEYMQDIRMNQAKRYLLDTQKPIHEISVLVGYHNTSNFTTAFKNTYGFTPKMFRGK
ncbi:helix-turn-helix transcriptional regulator [Flavobacterium ustbae]|uniref:helix-turn-helix transcriptional regulator n=1 Tax=Flavobacterium ustbae TaxID=2488790 RepID=UPI000F78B9E4|nr:AraC family transcriptional regulator [Flavobacterium ustbae]